MAFHLLQHLSSLSAILLLRYDRLSVFYLELRYLLILPSPSSCPARVRR